MTADRRRRARWMGPAMLVVAGMAAGAPAGAEVVEIPEWRNAFTAQGVGGTMVVRRLGETRSFVSDLDGAGRGLSPAATFAIPRLLIALETGVAVAGSAGALHDAATARAIGEDRMAAWLARIGYGNASVSGGIDRFWLDGGLRVTPAQQIGFVERLLLGTLPASTRSQVAARDAVPGERLGCEATLRGETGWTHPIGEDGPGVGWWVGWIERPREVWLFATAVEGHPERVREARRAVTLAVLDRLGIAGDGSCAPRAALAARAG